MKFLSTLLISLALTGLAFAQSTEITCPSLDPESFRADARCSDRTIDSFILVGTDALTTQHENFRGKLDQILNDHGSHPTDLTKKSIFALRTSHRCLQLTCTELLKNCAPTTLKKSDAFASTRWCQQTANTIFSAEKLTLSAAIPENITRKKRSLVREKWRQIEEKFHHFFLTNLIDLSTNLKHFEGKITNFLRNPA